ncbi:MAG: VCBS repeat-containing protein, partial [Bacteroidetes bacterium]|nr:VCBS repeat-containing protein [Bacteroidota bacterium]
GGYVKPGLFPGVPESFILKNKSTKGKIKFEKDVSQTDSTLSYPGMVADAVWADINKDGWMDLVVVGKFMPVTIFENHNGKLSNETTKYGLENTQGWWCRITAADFDNDGNTDFVIGNLGNNSQFKASAKEPLTITYADFNNDGVIDPVLCYYNQGKSYPYLTRDELFDQVPSLQKKFGRYADYADAQLSDIFFEDQLAKAKTVDVKMTQSVFLRNAGNNKFTITTLPNCTQISTTNGIVADDVDGDGNKDIIIAGNFYPFRAQQGPLDASMGAVLKGDSKGNFVPLPYSQTGLCIPGDVRNIIRIKQGNSFIIIAAKNNGAIQVIKKIN